MNAGIYAFDERALRGVIGRLSDENAQGELYLTDTVGLLVAGSRRVVPVQAVDYRLVLGVNDRVELAKARATMNERLCNVHMRAGVTIVDPATTYLEPGLAIGADTIIFPNTSIGGNSRLGRAHARRPEQPALQRALGRRRAHHRERRPGHRDRRPHDGRPVRAPARRQRPRYRRAHRRLRRTEEHAHGGRRESQPPRVSRRFDDRREHQHRRRHDHLQLRRRKQEPDHDRARGASSARTTRSSLRSRSATAPRRAPARS